MASPNSISFNQLASLVANSLKTRNSSPYASNWLERLRKIKNLRSKVARATRNDRINSTEQRFPFHSCSAQIQKDQSDQAPVSGSNSSIATLRSHSENETQWLKEDFTKYTT